MRSLGYVDDIGDEGREDRGEIFCLVKGYCIVK